MLLLILPGHTLPEGQQLLIYRIFFCRQYDVSIKRQRTITLHVLLAGLLVGCSVSMNMSRILFLNLRSGRGLLAGVGHRQHQRTADDRQQSRYAGPFHGA